jgi:GxxExxY protein
MTQNTTEEHGNCSQSKLLYPKLSYEIRGAIFNVYKTLGPFHKESIYQNALASELKKRNITFKQEVVIDIFYEEKKMGVYRPDFIVDNKIILEIKAVEFLPKNDERQLSYYLNGTSYRLGFLINFGSRNGVDIRRRIVGYENQ